jgi:hypothetical protein
MQDYYKIKTELWEKHTLIVDQTNSTQMEIFKGVYGNSKNFMTPHVIGYGVINPNKGIVYEVSQGDDFDYNTIYGVSVCNAKDKFYDDNKGGFTNIDDLANHIKSLIKKYED